MSSTTWRAGDCSPGAVELGADVVDHHARTLAGELEGVAPADAPSAPVTMTARASQMPGMAA